MIAYVQGKVDQKTEKAVVIDAGSIGYEVIVGQDLIDELAVGSDVRLVTYFHVREQSQELFGFKNASGKELFLSLISVSGVGPKMAMALIGLGEASKIKQAIANEDIHFLTGAPGVGKRLAEKVIVELRDKIGVIANEQTATEAGGSKKADDALEALVALGFSTDAAKRALVGLDPDLSTEDRVRQALLKGD